MPPDAKDHSLSWCAATENGGTEWLLLSFAEAVLTESIEVHANLNPGAVVRATVIAQDGTETEVWQGPGQSEGADRVTVLPLTSPFAIQGLKWTLDTAAVVG